jgi:putative spermidine/putrescine transport system ATP-binding protein
MSQQMLKSGNGLPLHIAGVNKSYATLRVLADIDLEIAAGEFLTLLGPSGSGKTTLLMVLAGFVRPDAGSIRFGEREMVLTPPHKRNLGIVFQNYALFPHMNVAENIGYPLRLRGVPREDVRRRIDQAIELVRLQGLGERRIDQLSGGQRQRVALARAIVFEPDILLMDEPLSALDKNLREHMQIELKRLHRTLGLTTVYVTHDQREALTLSDRVAVMNHGRVVQIADPTVIYDQPNSEFVAGFVGQSNMLPLRREGGDLFYGRSQIKSSRPVPAEGALKLAVRPEKLEIAQANVPAINRFDGKVKEIVYQGDTLMIYACLEDGSELALQRMVSRRILTIMPAIGDTIVLTLDPNDVAFVPADPAA